MNAPKLLMRKEAAKLLGTNASHLKKLEAQGAIQPIRDSQRRPRYTRELVEQIRPIIAAQSDGQVAGPVPAMQPALATAPAPPISPLPPQEPDQMVFVSKSTLPPHADGGEDTNASEIDSSELAARIRAICQEEAEFKNKSLATFFREQSDPRTNYAVSSFFTGAFNQLCAEFEIDPDQMWDTMITHLRKQYWGSPEPAPMPQRQFSPPPYQVPATIPAPQVPRPSRIPQRYHTQATYPQGAYPPPYAQQAPAYQYHPPVPQVPESVRLVQTEIAHLQAERELQKVKKEIEREEAEEARLEAELDAQREERQRKAEVDEQLRIFNFYQSQQALQMASQQQIAAQQAAQEQQETDRLEQQRTIERMESMQAEIAALLSRLPENYPMSEMMALKDSALKMLKDSPTEATLISVRDLIARAATPYESQVESEQLKQDLYSQIMRFERTFFEVLGEDAEQAADQAVRGFLAGADISTNNYGMIITDARNVRDEALAPYREAALAFEEQERQAAEQEEAQRQAEWDAQQQAQMRKAEIESVLQQQRFREQDKLLEAIKSDGEPFDIVQRSQILNQAEEETRARLNEIDLAGLTDDIVDLARETFSAIVDQLVGES